MTTPHIDQPSFNLVSPSERTPPRERRLTAMDALVALVDCCAMFVVGMISVFSLLFVLIALPIIQSGGIYSGPEDAEPQVSMGLGLFVGIGLAVSTAWLLISVSLGYGQESRNMARRSISAGLAAAAFTFLAINALSDGALPPSLVYYFPVAACFILSLTGHYHSRHRPFADGKHPGRVSR